jgi:outer membrane protein assembly factor BamE (lipoprotein component of BamABCDE complex)
MSIRNLLFLAALSLNVSCSSDLFLDHTGNMPEESHIKQLQLGQSKEKVYDILGAPSLVTGLNDNHWIDMESSVRRFAFMRSTELERNILALAFKDNKLESIEKHNLEDGYNISIDSDETKPSDRELGFFRKYFGGVGQYQAFGDGKTMKEM